MSGIRQWLEDLGLGQYADAFEQNDIDEGLLPDLTDEALEKLGVVSMGHRMKFLKAIGASANSNVEPEGVATEPAPAPKVLSGDAERRQLTVMFCDLVGSTALSEQLDPEDLRTLMQSYQQAAGTVIARYDGHVAQYLGDGLMVYFGWPKAHEDDAQRAIRAGLDIVEAVRDIEAPTPLSVRVGISTGSVVVGETGDGDASVPKAAVGETPNLAARVQGLAAPNTVAIAEVTRRLVGGAFELESLGSRELKGIEGAVSVHRVLGESAADSRFEAAHVGRLTPLVGRETEIAMLLERWDQAKDNEGQVILLSGEPGIGKSRIAQTLRERIGEEPHTRLRYQCSPYHTNSAFHPIVEQIAKAARFDRDDEPDAKIDKLEALLSQSAEDVASVAPLFAALLSLPTDRYPPSNLSAQRQKEDTIASLADQTVSLSLRDPVLMIFEDVHWIDPTSLEVLNRVIDRIQDAAVLVVITCRPEFDAPWTGHGHVTLHSLNRLGRRQGADLVRKVTGDKALPDDVLNEIIAKTDGVPLFVEELTKAVLEAGFLKAESDRYVMDGPLPPLAIPTTLQDSLMARLDRLAIVKEVAQVGACIGREFNFELLAAISPIGGNELHDALRELAASELVFQRGVPPDAIYAFKHALIQDAAYASLLKSRRQQFHISIAEALKTRFPDTAQNQPELLAHHYTEAGLTDQAIEYWVEAGKRASLRSANKESISHLNNGLELVLSQAQSPERDHRELEIQVAMGPPVIAINGFAADETGQVYARALDLCRKFQHPPQLFQIFYGLCVNQMFRGNQLKARDLCEEFARRADTLGDLSARIVAHRLFGAILLYMGDLPRARSEMENALALYDTNPQGSLTQEYGHDPKVYGAGLLSLTLTILGYPDQGALHVRESTAHAEKLEHPFMIAMANSMLLYLYFVKREPDSALAHAEAELKISLEQSFRYTENVARLAIAWVRAQKSPVRGIPELTEALEFYRSLQTRVYLPLFLDAYAQTCIKVGQSAEAHAAVAEALSMTETDGDRWFEAELRRLNGELLLTGSEPQPAEAETCLKQALVVARSQEAKLWELRTAVTLGRLWQSQGKADEARDLLAPIYNWFTEGFDTADLKDAKALLDELK